MASSISLDLPVHFLIDRTVMHPSIVDIRMTGGQAKAEPKCYAEKALLCRDDCLGQADLSL